MRFQNLAAFAAVALVISTAPAFAAKGQWSLGGNFGVGTYSNTQFNETLPTGVKEVKDGWEYGGTLRYGMSEKNSLEIEGMQMDGKSTTDVGGDEGNIHTKGFATPVNLLIGLSQNDKYDFNAIVGAGPVWGMKGTADGAFTGETSSKTSFMGQGGFEGDYMMSRQFALSGRVLGRYAKASDVDLDKTDPSQGTTDINMSGFAFNLGLRMFFGGGQ